MRILIVTHTYRPDPMPRAYRWTAIAEEWASRGTQVDVVTTGRQSGEASDQQSGVVVHRVGERLIGRLTGRLKPKRSSEDLGSPGRGGIRGVIFTLAKRIYDSIWKQIFWPDYACLWYWPGLRKAKRLCGANRYDCVITVSHPFTGHLVGLGLKKAFPGLRWVVDIGDPFSLDSTVPSNNVRLYRRLNRRIDRRVLEVCDAISVTVEGCKASLIDEFSLDSGKIKVIPPLFSLSQTPKADAPPFAKNGFIDLVYIGVLYADIRRPDGLLSLLNTVQSSIANIRLHFFGEQRGCDDCFSRFPQLMEKTVVLHGPVARNRVSAILSSADILINIGNQTSHQLPSKLVEYIAAGKPILNVVGADVDTSVEFLKDYPAALSLTCDSDGPSADATRRVVEFLREPPEITKSCIDRLLGEFELKPITDAYTGLAAPEALSSGVAGSYRRN